MSLIRDKLNTYIDYLEKVKKDKDYKPTPIEKEADYYVNNDSSLKGIISELNSTDDYLKKKEIINSFDNNKTNTIDISKINYLKLNNGKEVYSFVDSNGVRRVVENNKLGNISSQLNGKDYIMEDMIRNNNNEIKMTQIDEFINDPNNFKNLSKNELDNLKAIIANKDQMKIKYINKDNMILLDESGNVLEAYFDLKDNTSKIGTPDSINYNQNELSEETNVNTSININNNVQSNEVDSEIKEGEVEDEKNNFSPELIERVSREIEAKNLNISLSDALRNIPLYYEVPTKIDSDFNAELIDENEKEFYDNMTSLYAEDLAKKRAKSMSKSLDLSKDTRGIASVFLLALILFVVAVIILFNMN